MFRSKHIDIPLESRRARAVFVLAVILSAVVLAAAAARVALPAQLADRDNIGVVRIAAELDPANDSIQHQLGRREFAFAHFAQARIHLERALALNPNHPNYWADLAQLCYMTADFGCATRSYDRAVELAPMRPQFAWDRVTYFAVTGGRGETLAGFSRFVQLSPNGANAAFDTALRLYHDPDVVWRSVAVPAGMNAKVALLTFLASRGEGDQTVPLWDQVAGQQLPPDGMRAYTEALVQRGEFSLAQRVWSALERSSASQGSHSSNLIYNADFQSAPTNSGFDWHLAPQWFVETAVDRQDGRSAMRISYTVAHNEDSEPLYEFVSVLPNQAYVLTAEVKADGITSSSGPRLRVIDAECAQCLDVTSEPVVGTTGWKRLDVSFHTAAKTRVIRVSVVRPRARAFPMDITGTVWVTAFDLAATGAAPAPLLGGQSQ